MFHAELAYKTV